MTSGNGVDRPPSGVDTELVEYFIVAVPDVERVGGVAVALAELQEADAIRILDAVVLEREADGTAVAHELDAVPAMTALRKLVPDRGGYLSDDDLFILLLAIEPGTAGVVVVAEDRWATSLSSAAQRTHGRIVAGDRIPSRRVEGCSAGSPSGPALEDRSVPVAVRRTGSVGLLARPPSGVADPERGLESLVVDPAAQVHELASLLERGLLSTVEYERLKRRTIFAAPGDH